MKRRDQVKIVRHELVGPLMPDDARWLETMQKPMGIQVTQLEEKPLLYTAYGVPLKRRIGFRS